MQIPKCQFRYKRLLSGDYLFVVLIVLLFSGYFVYQLRNFLVGPQILVHNLTEYSEANDPFFEIAGKAKNISRLDLNGRKIFTGKEGHFKESLLLAPGTNIVQLKAEDKFGHQSVKRYYISIKSR